MTDAVPETIAVLDACVLYPPSLRDLLMRVAGDGIYEPRWTEEIHTEWIRNVLAGNPGVTPAQLDRTRRLMNQAVPNGLVSDHEARIPLPEPAGRKRPPCTCGRDRGSCHRDRHIQPV
jgi:hypothetical protein